MNPFINLDEVRPVTITREEIDRFIVASGIKPAMPRDIVLTVHPRDLPGFKALSRGEPTIFRKPCPSPLK